MVGGDDERHHGCDAGVGVGGGGGGDDDGSADSSFMYKLGLTVDIIIRREVWGA